jgi:hypothetical protein
MAIDKKVEGKKKKGRKHEGRGDVCAHMSSALKKYASAQTSRKCCFCVAEGRWKWHGEACR